MKNLPVDLHDEPITKIAIPGKEMNDRRHLSSSGFF